MRGSWPGSETNEELEELLHDTNVFVHLARKDAVAQALMDGLGLDKNSAVIASAVTLGVIDYLGRHQGWTEKTLQSKRQCYRVYVCASQKLRIQSLFKLLKRLNRFSACSSVG